MKRILCVCVSVLIVAYLYGEEIMDTVDIDENLILSVVLVDGKTPAVTFYEERKGLISDITECFVIYKGKRLGPYDDYTFPFSVSGNLIVWLLRNDKYYIYVDKEELGPFDGSYDLVFSPNDKALAYRTKIGGNYYVHTGTAEFGPFDEVDDLVFSSDNKTLAYRAKINGKYYIYIGAEKIGFFDDANDLTFSPDGKTLAYSAKVDGRWYVYVGKEKKAGPFDEVGDLTFSPDGQILAYSVEIDSKRYVYVGREKIGPFDIASVLPFDTASKIFSYLVGIDGKLYYKVFINGHLYPGSIDSDGNTVYVREGKIILIEP